MVTPEVDGLAKFVHGRLYEDRRDAATRQSPADLARVRAYEWLLTEWMSLREQADDMRATGSPDYIRDAISFDAMASMYEPAVRLLAAAWDGHPDYNRRWRYR